MFDIKEQLRLLPDKPGVYLMKDRENEIIYVGKAISLKNRVRQYFQSLKNQPPKVRAMVANIRSFEYIVTDSELEALILECNLIKENRPKYNILLRDDKTYPYIKVTIKEDYPRIIKTRNFKKDGSRYFGPYSNVSALNETMEAIHQLFPIRTCKRNIKNSIEKKERPCLNYHIGKCVGPCTGRVDPQDYMEMIREIIMFLSGREDELIKKMGMEMKKAAQNLNYEKAALYRDQLIALENIVEKQKIVSSHDIDQDIIAAAKDSGESCVQVFHIRAGKVVQRHQYFLSINNEDVAIGHILSSFVKQFYNNMTFIPKEILVEEDLEDNELIQSWLSDKRGNKVTIRKPKIGEKKQLMDMVKKNATLMMEERREIKIRKKEQKARIMNELQEKLNLEEMPYRIEAFDISNIQGVESVGSMVVFEDGKPINKDYRRFKIKSIDGANDYGSLEEIISRRFKRGLTETRQLIEGKLTLSEGRFSKFPDLIMVDGGLGQVNIVERTLLALNIDIPVCGMVKDNKHRTRDIIYRGEELGLEKSSSLLHFVARIQDEVHRFAITYHRSLRRETALSSILEDIPGIGTKRRIALMQHFKGIDRIKKATKRELMEVKALNKANVESIYNYFNKD